MILILFQGYILGNPKTDKIVDKNSQIPFAHGMGLISNELYEVTQFSSSTALLKVTNEKRERANMK